MPESVISKLDAFNAELDFGDGHHVDASSDEGATITLNRLRKPVRVVVFLTVVALLLVASFIAGRFVQAPNSAAVQAAQQTIPVTVRVEERVVAQHFEVAATVTAGPTVSLTPMLSTSGVSVSTKSSVSDTTGTDNSTLPGRPEGSEAAGAGTASGSSAGRNVDTPQNAPAPERAVVTGAKVQLGQTIAYGQLLGEVSGRPVFSAPSTFPLYRDLIPGSMGEDVLALQRLLLSLGYASVQTTGKFDAVSLNALDHFYQNNGYAVPIIGSGIKGFSWREFLAVPNDASVVTQMASAGTVLEGETTLITLKTSPDVISARVNVAEADKLTVGQTLLVIKGVAAPVEAQVTAISEFTVDEATKWSGRTVTVTLPPALGWASASEPLKLRSSSQPAPGIALPVVAVRQDSSGTYVVLAPGGSTADTVTEAAPEQRVFIKVLAQSGGWVAIEPVDLLPVGAQIQVPA